MKGAAVKGPLISLNLGTRFSAEDESKTAGRYEKDNTHEQNEKGLWNYRHRGRCPHSEMSAGGCRDLRQPPQQREGQE